MKIECVEMRSMGTNMYLVWDEESREAMLIDPGEYSQAIDDLIRTNKLILKYIALTHGHADHIGGVKEFMKKHPDARLAAGEHEVELLGDAKMNASRAIFRESIELEADLLLKEGDEIKLGTLTFKVIETPGHTPGGITFYVKGFDPKFTNLDKGFSGTAFTGDTLFHGSVGRTDLPGGDVNTLFASIRNKLFTLPADTMVLPGHLDATSIEYEKRHNPFVR